MVGSEVKVEASERAAHAPALQPRDWLLAILVCAAAGTLYVGTFQTWLFGDGPQLVNTFTAAPAWQARWIHPLYFPVADSMRSLGLDADPTQPLRAVSFVCAALGVALTFLLARCLGAPRSPALAAAALLALTPANWFFGTTIEIYALHQCAAVLAGLIVLWAARSPSRAALPVLHACLPLVFLTHLSGILLLPGLLLLVRMARSGAGRPLTTREFTLRLVLPAAAVQLLLMVAVNAWSGRGVGTGTGWALGFIEKFQNPVSLRMLWNEWAMPLALLLPLAGAALAWRRIPTSMRFAVAAVAVPSTLFFVWYGTGERGGYFLGTAPFLAALVAVGAARAGRLGLALLLVCTPVQALLGHAYVTQGEGIVDRAVQVRRAEQVEKALGERGVLISFEPTLQTIQARLPGISEVNFAPSLANAKSSGVSPTEFMEDVYWVVEETLRVGEQPIALDQGYRRWLGAAPDYEPHFEQLERGLAERFECELLEDELWPMLVLRQKRR